MTNINTTATMKKTSAMLMGKCEKTQKNLRRMMAEAGCADGEVMKVTLPLTPGAGTMWFSPAERREFLLSAREGMPDARGGGGDFEELRGDVTT